MTTTCLIRLALMLALGATAAEVLAAQLSITPSYPSYGENVTVELRDTQYPTYLPATRYRRVGWNIMVEYEYTTEPSVLGRADFGNAVLQLGQLVPGTYAIEARLFKMGDPSVAPVVVSQALVIQPPAQWGMYVVPREPEAFVPIDIWLNSAAYFEPGSMRTTVSGNVIRVDFDYRGDAPVGPRAPSGTVASAATRIPPLAPGNYEVQGWGREKASGITGLYFIQPFTVAATVPVVEYYSEADDQYLMPASPLDIAVLDAGSHWKRTGLQFSAWLRMGDGPLQAKPVCRFQVAGSTSHFYTSTAADCAYLKALETVQRNVSEAANQDYLGWTYENIAFYALLPENGHCAPGSTPVYRSYNHRAEQNDSNHRYTADPGQRAAMAMSWNDEGVAFCSPARQAS